MTSPAATLTVNNVPPPPDSIAYIIVAPSSTTVIATLTTQLTATAFNSAGTIEPAAFSWSSSNPTDATVRSNGLVGGLAVGTTQIVASAQTTGINNTTITVNSNAATVNVTTAPTLTSIVVSPALVSVPEGSRQHN